MTDRELLELAAKAAGIKGIYRVNGYRNVSGISETMDSPLWNPIIDDGDALRLAVKLGIHVIPHTNSRRTKDFTRAFSSKDFDEPHNGDPDAATRRAIVRAAAEIGKAMP